MKRARTKKGISGVKCERILICGWFMFLVANYTVCLFVRLVRQVSVRQWGDWEHCVQVTLWCSMKLCCVEDHLTWGCCSLSLILNNCSCLLPLALVKLVKDFLADPVWIQFAKYDNGSTLEIAQILPFRSMTRARTSSNPDAPFPLNPYTYTAPLVCLRHSYYHQYRAKTGDEIERCWLRRMKNGKFWIPEISEEWVESLWKEIF